MSSRGRWFVKGRKVKICLSLLVSAVLLSSVIAFGDYLPGLAFSEAAPVARVSVSDVFGNPGDYVDVTISLDENPGLGTLEVHLNFDASVLSLLEVSCGGVMSLPELPSMTTNSLVFVFEAPNPPVDFYDTGNLATVRFKINENANTAVVVPLTLTGNFAFNFEREPRTIVPTNGTVTVMTEANPVQVSVSEVSGEPGEYVDVVISLDYNPGIVSLEVHLNYDNAILQLINITGYGTLSLPMLPAFDINSLRFLFDSPNPTVNAYNVGNLATIRFRINQNAQAGTVTPLTLTGSIAFDELLDFHIVLPSNGSLTIPSPPPTLFVRAPGSVSVVNCIDEYVTFDVTVGGMPPQQTFCMAYPVCLAGDACPALLYDNSVASIVIENLPQQYMRAEGHLTTEADGSGVGELTLIIVGIGDFDLDLGGIVLSPCKCEAY